MNEQPNNTNSAFMEVTSRKLDRQDKKISELQEVVTKMTDGSDQIQRLISTVETLKSEIRTSAFPAEKMQAVARQLDSVIYLSKQQNKVIHHHHVPKMIWIAAGLFISLTLVSSGWYMTADKLTNFVTNDTKYRHIRLDTAQRAIQDYLDREDRLFTTQPDMRKKVLEIEQEYRANFERLQRAERLKAEAKDLEKEAKKKK
jgi:hypothetical protein